MMQAEKSQECCSQGWRVLNWKRSSWARVSLWTGLCAMGRGGKGAAQALCTGRQARPGRGSGPHPALCDWSWCGCVQARQGLRATAPLAMARAAVCAQARAERRATAPLAVTGAAVCVFSLKQLPSQPGVCFPQAHGDPHRGRPRRQTAPALHTLSSHYCSQRTSTPCI